MVIPPKDNQSFGTEICIPISSFLIPPTTGAKQLINVIVSIAIKKGIINLSKIDRFFIENFLIRVMNTLQASAEDKLLNIRIDFRVERERKGIEEKKAILSKSHLFNRRKWPRKNSKKHHRERPREIDTIHFSNSILLKSVNFDSMILPTEKELRNKNIIAYIIVNTKILIYQ